MRGTFLFVLLAGFVAALAAPAPLSARQSGDDACTATASTQEQAQDSAEEGKTPEPEDISHISVQRSALAPRDKNDVTLLREDHTKTFDLLARVLVERGFFDLQEDYNQDKILPEPEIMRITVYYGSPSQRKMVTRWVPKEFDEAWEFEMLIRGAANRYREEMSWRTKR